MNSIQLAYQEGVKLAMAECGLIKQALGSPELQFLAKQVAEDQGANLLGNQLRRLLAGARDVATKPAVMGGAGGAALGGLAGGLTGDEDSNTLARVLAGMGIGGAAGAGGAIGIPKAIGGVKGLIGAGRMGKGLRGMGKEMESRARAAAPTPQSLAAVAD